MCRKLYSDNVLLCSEEEEKTVTHSNILLVNRFFKNEIDRLRHKNKKKKNRKKKTKKKKTKKKTKKTTKKKTNNLNQG